MAAGAILGAAAAGLSPGNVAQRPTAWSAAAMNLHGAPQAVHRMMGSGGLAVLVSGPPGAKGRWQFGYQDVVIAHGSVQLDAQGLGQIKLLVAPVRARLECTLLVTDGRRSTMNVVVFPRSRLEHNRRGIEALSLAAVDPRGLLHKALVEEGVAFADATASPADDDSAAAVMIVGGYDDPAALAQLCRGLDRRVRAGMDLIVLDPPPLWSGWGLSVEAGDLSGPVLLDKRLGQALETADLGRGPWPATIKGGTALAWVAGGGAAPAALMVDTTVGKGHVIVAALPQATAPLTDAVGRGVMDEALLWVLKRRSAAGGPQEIRR